MKPYYQDEKSGITIYHGDCREVLASFPECFRVDLVLTDPPYGVTQNSWDDLKVTIDCFDRFPDTPIVCTCQNPASAELVCRYRNRFKWSDVWKKTQAVGFLNCRVMPMRNHEDILVFSSGRMPFNPQVSKKPQADIRPHGNTAMSTNYGKFSETRTRTIQIDEGYPKSVIEFANCQDGLHPNQKPLPLMKYLILSYSAEGQSLLDPFMGSGTTLLAAKDLGRKALGIEKDEQHCEIAAKRMSQEVFQFA